MLANPLLNMSHLIIYIYIYNIYTFFTFIFILQYINYMTLCECQCKMTKRKQFLVFHNKSIWALFSSCPIVINLVYITYTCIEEYIIIVNEDILPYTHLDSCSFKMCAFSFIILCH